MCNLLEDKDWFLFLDKLCFFDVFLIAAAYFLLDEVLGAHHLMHIHIHFPSGVLLLLDGLLDNVRWQVADTLMSQWLVE